LIADLPSGSFELYDLESDPGEREDLAASTDPSPWVDALHAWHDSLRAGATLDALALGRLEDDRAAPLLVELLGDRDAEAADRLEAARLLGALGDASARPALVAALSDEAIALEAAIALATLGDGRAASRLSRALGAADIPASTRALAAIALGRLGDGRAVPALIDVLEREAGHRAKRDAIGALYRLRDARAVPALLAATADSQLRYRAITAIGLTESRDAFEPLAAMLAEPHRTMIRDGLARALGWIGDERAIPALAEMAARDAELIYVTEALVRLDATRAPSVGGSDVGPGARGLRGIGRCHRGEPHDIAYRWQTWCEARDEVAIPLGTIPEGSTIAVLSARSLEAAPIEIELTLGGRTFTATLDTEWSEQRFPLESLDAQVAVLRPTGRAAIDHLLVLSSASSEEDPALDELGEHRADPLD
jgi:HEAT repeat protein